MVRDGRDLDVRHGFEDHGSSRSRIHKEIVDFPWDVGRFVNTVRGTQGGGAVVDLADRVCARGTQAEKSKNRRRP